MENDLKSKVTTWLETQGYPLEMRVASSFREVGFDVSQGEYYDDPETQTAREIDVVAVKRDKYGILEIYIVVECKKSTDKPWILFTSDMHESGRNKFFTYAIMSQATSGILIKKAINKSDQDLLWLNKPKRKGYGMAVAFSKGEDPAYKAALSALKASISQKGSEIDANFSNSLKLVFPVIVLEGNLFETYLDKKGSTIVQEIDEGAVTYYRKISGCPVSSVRIVTTKKLGEFCEEAFEEAIQLEILLNTEIEKILKQMNDSKSGIRRVRLPKPS